MFTKGHMMSYTWFIQGFWRVYKGFIGCLFIEAYKRLKRCAGGLLEGLSRF